MIRPWFYVKSGMTSRRRALRASGGNIAFTNRPSVEGWSMCRDVIENTAAGRFVNRPYEPTTT